MRVLIADDDSLFRAELAELLVEEGHHSVPVGSADEAIAALEREWFDALLTDLRMPHKSGTVLLDEVRRRWPGVRPVILTGQPTDEAIASGLRHGAFNFIGKPCQLGQVLWVLNLVEEDLGLGEKVAPPWDPKRVPPVLQTDADRTVTMWGDPLPGLPSGVFQPFADGADPPDESASLPPAGPPGSATLLHFGWSERPLVPPDLLLRQAGRIVRGLPSTSEVVAVADRRLFTTPDLLSLWQILRGSRAPAGLSSAQGPQRREILRRLYGRELEEEVLTREVASPGTPGRPRLYLENLVVAGLVEVHGGRYRLSPTGREVVELLTEVDATDGRLPRARSLYSEGPARTPRPLPEGDG